MLEIISSKSTYPEKTFEVPAVSDNPIDTTPNSSSIDSSTMQTTTAVVSNDLETSSTIDSTITEQTTLNESEAVKTNQE